MFIRTDALLPVGEETAIRLWLPDETPLVLRGRVAHMLTPASARALGRHPGMGFEITQGDASTRLKLRAHVDSIRAETTSPGLSTTTQVIVIEPTSPLRARMARALEAAGFKVTPCSSATEALDTCQIWRPDAIIAAQMLGGGMTGTDLAYAMTEHSTLSDVPLILIGDDGDLGRLEAFRAGIRDYIPRPFLDEELVIRTHRVAAPQTGQNPGLRGSIVDIGLGTLLSLFEFERKSGILLLLRHGEIARVFVSDGRILKVESSIGNGVPRDRMMRLLDWHDGQFEFTPCAIGGRDELNASVTQILLEHARTRDEAAEVVPLE